MKQPRRISWPLLLAVLAAVGLLFALKNDGIRASTEQMDKEVSQSRVQLSSVQRVNMDLKAELAMVDTDEYIESQARLRGYLKPGELRFVITNPEALYGSGEEAPVLEVVAQGDKP